MNTLNTASKTAIDFDASPCRRGSDSFKWNRYASEGDDVIAAWVADTDFLTPRPVIEAVSARLDGGPLGYCDLPPELIEVFLQRMQRLYNWQIDPATLVPLSGVVPGLFGAARTASGPGDGVIAQSPNYHHFFGAAQLSDRKLLKLNNRIVSGHWQMDFDQLEAIAAGGAKSLLLCNPHNPVGRVLTREELETIADICLRNELMICSDEIHAEIILDEHKSHIPIATLSPEIADKTITLLSPSKAFNLPGIGGFAFAVIPNAELREDFIAKIHGIATQPGSLAYAAGLAAYRDCDEWLSQQLDYLRGNRDLLQAEVAATPGLSMTHVEATFLAWIDVSKLALESPFEHFLAHGVALSDGAPMGDPNYLRLNFGCTRATLQEIIKRIKSAVKAA
ncbi:MAG: PatB family C-S lyase [Halioglobus sp.]